MIDIVFTICETFFIIAYLFTNVLILRSIIIIGCLGYLAGALWIGFHADGMKAVIFFSLLTITINVVQIWKIIINRRPIFLPEKVQGIYSKSFHMMTTQEFKSIYEVASIKKAIKGQYLTKQDESIDELILLIKGRVNIIKDNCKLVSLEEGFFIGEMSFLTGGAASATVEVEEEGLEYMVWSKASLDRLSRRKSELYDKLKQAIAINLIEKISHQARSSSQVIAEED